MTREQKLEAMARAWCTFNGWNPDADEFGLVLSKNPARTTVRPKEGCPIWKRHVPAMVAVLDAIEVRP